MKVLKEYRLLNQNVRATRKVLRGALAGITLWCKEYNLDESNADMVCINRFDSVRAKSLSADLLDDNGLVKFCDKYDCHHLCENNNCGYQEQNWDAVAAQIAYDDARKERRTFTRNLFRKRAK